MYTDTRTHTHAGQGDLTGTSKWHVVLSTVEQLWSLLFGSFQSTHASMPPCAGLMLVWLAPTAALMHPPDLGSTTPCRDVQHRWQWALKCMSQKGTLFEDKWAAINIYEAPWVFLRICEQNWQLTCRWRGQSRYARYASSTQAWTYHCAWGLCECTRVCTQCMWEKCMHAHNVLQELMITLEEQCEVNPALHSAAVSVLYTFGCSVTGSPDSARPLTLLSGVTS